MKKLTKKEEQFIESIKTLNSNKEGSFVLSTKKGIYHGIPYETAVLIHGEESAIGVMLAEEGKKAKFRMILIVGSAKEIIMPCGRCLVAIKKYGVPKASIFCATKSFSKVEKFSILELYPNPCDEKWLFD